MCASDRPCIQHSVASSCQAVAVLTTGATEKHCIVSERRVARSHACSCIYTISIVITSSGSSISFSSTIATATTSIAISKEEPIE